MDIRKACLKALRKADKWPAGAAVVKTDKGYKAISGKSLIDASYAAIQDIYLVVERSCDILDGTADDYNDEQLLELIDWYLAADIS